MNGGSRRENEWAARSKFAQRRFRAIRRLFKRPISHIYTRSQNSIRKNRILDQTNFDLFIPWGQSYIYIAHARGKGRPKPTALRAAEGANLEIISRNFKHTYVFGGGPEARGHLATLSKAQSMIRKEQKATGQKVTQEQKRSAIEILKGKTEKESEIELFSLFQAAASVSEDKATRISATETELRLAISNELLEKLNRVKEIWAHRNSSFTWAELDEAMTNDCLKRHDPKLKSQSKALTQARLGQKAASEVSRRNQNPSNRSPIAADNASALRGLK